MNGDKTAFNGLEQVGSCSEAERPRGCGCESSFRNGKEAATVVTRSQVVAGTKKMDPRYLGDDRPIQSGGPLMKSKQAANYLAISERQLQYLSQRGEVAVIRIGKSGVRYDRLDLDAFVAHHRRLGLGMQSEVAVG
jgi:hypothetical protein